MLTREGPSIYLLSGAFQPCNHLIIHERMSEYVIQICLKIAVLRPLREPERIVNFLALFSPSEKQVVLGVVRNYGGCGVVFMAPVFQSDADLLYPLILPSMCHRIDKQISRFRRWLPKKPMRLDKETLPDLEENDCYTAPFSQQRIHQ